MTPWDLGAVLWDCVSTELNGGTPSWSPSGLLACGQTHAPVGTGSEAFVAFARHRVSESPVSLPQRKPALHWSRGHAGSGGALLLITVEASGPITRHRQGGEGRAGAQRTDHSLQFNLPQRTVQVADSHQPPRFTAIWSLVESSPSVSLDSSLKSSFPPACLGPGWGLLIVNIQGPSQEQVTVSDTVAEAALAGE